MAETTIELKQNSKKQNSSCGDRRSKKQSSIGGNATQPTAYSVQNSPDRLHNYSQLGNNR